jgi:hypothetical protein
MPHEKSLLINNDFLRTEVLTSQTLINQCNKYHVDIFISRKIKDDVSRSVYKLSKDWVIEIDEQE